MWEFIGRCVKAIVPPADANPQAVYRYRVAVSVWLLVSSSVIVFHIALACGYFANTIIGFSGFARASSVNDVAAVVMQIRVSQLDTKIRDDQTQFCKAQELRNGEAMREKQDRLYKELDSYRELTRHEYRLPGCDILIAK